MHGVIEEKQQRISEVLLGSVSPFKLMLGKLLGVVGVALTVGGVYAAGRVVGHEVRGDEVTLEADIPERLLERYREHLR